MSNRTIIIIDDDEDILLLLKRILAATGMPLIFYKSGKEFLENLIRTKARIAVVLLDLNMPGINGLVVLKKIQELRKFTKFKVCVLSAYNDPAVIAKATELGADAFLIKPVDKTALLIKVKELLTVQNITLGEDTYAKVCLPASLLNSPLYLSFNVVGITPEKILVECIYNIREEAEISFVCKDLCAIVSYDKEFTFKVIKTAQTKTRFLIAGEFIGMTAIQAQSLKSYVAQNIHEEISFFEGIGS